MPGSNPLPTNCSSREAPNGRSNPGRDAANMERINQVLGDELDVPLIAMGPRGENFVQTYQTRWGCCSSI